MLSTNPPGPDFSPPKFEGGTDLTYRLIPANTRPFKQMNSVVEGIGPLGRHPQKTRRPSWYSEQTLIVIARRSYFRGASQGRSILPKIKKSNITTGRNGH